MSNFYTVFLSVESRNWKPRVLIGWFPKVSEYNGKPLFVFACTPKSTRRRTITEKDRTDQPIELFPNFMAHFKSVGQKKWKSSPHEKSEPRWCNPGDNLIALVAALHCRNYRRNRCVLFVYHFLKSKFWFKAKLGAGLWLVCYAAG